MGTVKAFWSYSHADDDTEAGRIVRLGKDIAAQYTMITGEKIELFIDRKDLAWGDDWENIIESNIASFAFFIPVVTTRYLQSPECRKELNMFARRAKKFGVDALIMPIVYCETKRLNNASDDDDAVALIQSYQWEDWTDKRFASLKSARYRRSVAELATKIYQANDAIEQQAGSLPIVNPAELAPAKTNQSTSQNIARDDLDVQGNDDGAGMVDVLADMENTFPEWVHTIEALNVEIGSIGTLTTEASVELNAVPSNKGFSAKVPVFKKLSAKLDPPAERISALSNQFTTQLYGVDEGIRTIGSLIGQQSPNEDISSVDNFLTTLKELDASSQEGLGALNTLLESMTPLEHMSRDLKKPLRKIRKGLTSMYEGREVISSWVSVIEDAKNQRDSKSNEQVGAK
jgi:hypothetical protein